MNCRKFPRIIFICRFQKKSTLPSNHAKFNHPSAYISLRRIFGNVSYPKIAFYDFLIYIRNTIVNWNACQISPGKIVAAFHLHFHVRLNALRVQIIHFVACHFESSFFPYVDDSETNICGGASIECYKKVEYNFTEYCDCLPSCTQITYDAEITETSDNKREQMAILLDDDQLFKG